MDDGRTLNHRAALVRAVEIIAEALEQCQREGIELPVSMIALEVAHHNLVEGFHEAIDASQGGEHA